MPKTINGVPVVSMASVVLPDRQNPHLVKAAQLSEKAARLVTQVNKELEQGGAIKGRLVYNKPI